jgi:hypothetical protein
MSFEVANKKKWGNAGDISTELRVRGNPNLKSAEDVFTTT